ncbi:MAG: transglutaminase domain-containing protein [Lentimicrobiaceae bacterium]|nr:transglutaminase domain-containing protein [Lentimicrobiaceae bacterium]
MKKNLLFVLFLFPAILFAQQSGKFHQQFEKRIHSMPRISEQVDAYIQDLNFTQKNYMEFLYAYMPLADIADQSPEYFLKNVNASIEAKNTFSWGKTTPEDIFLHFVLPVRINNENLDTARLVFFRELKNRIKGMTMEQAALEVNHWCHEKVNYQPTDTRTSAPLSTVRTAYGRCGEESTFTVAALRSCGIPARQCYTPRWAHTDDNHAWVEVWTDGKWHFLGACEPEPLLDMAWFAAPAKRAMMVHTNVFGKYNGLEEIISREPYSTKINLLTNYAPTRRLYVKVTDLSGKVVSGATVKFKLYNYSEFYPLVTKQTNDKGLTSTVTGFGDLIIWANNGNDFGYKKVTVEKTDTLHLCLDKRPGKEYIELFDLVPPIERSLEPVSDAGRKLNDQRVAQEDSIRNAYRATFIDSTAAIAFAKKYGYDADSTWTLLRESQGNWREITRLMSETTGQQKAFVFPLLASVAEKDLRDTPSDFLADHLQNSMDYRKSMDKKIFTDYVLCPRIGYELITPYKSFLRDAFEKTFADECRKDPSKIASWILQNITIDDKANYCRTPITPAGTLKVGITDKASRNILFVAICRSFGIPSRLEPATKVPQYYAENSWKDIRFEAEKQVAQSLKGTLVLNNTATTANTSPVYYQHYTIARFADGDYESLDYEFDESLKTFPCTLSVDTGYYMTVTGNRMNDGTILSKVSFFNLAPGQQRNVDIDVRPLDVKPNILSKVDAAKTFLVSFENKKQSLAETANGKGLILCFIEPGKEPTNHAMNDIKLLRDNFEKWGGGMAFILDDKKNTPASVKAEYKNMPAQSSYFLDKNNVLIDKIGKALGKRGFSNLPVILLIGPDGNIYYFSEGYSIGTGEQLYKNTKLIN